MRSIIDSHSHLFGNEADIPDFERAADTLGIVKICFMGLDSRDIRFRGIQRYAKRCADGPISRLFRRHRPMGRCRCVEG